MATLSASALPVCSPMPLPTSLPPRTCVDIFYFFLILWVGSLPCSSFLFIFLLFIYFFSLCGAAAVYCLSCPVSWKPTPFTPPPFWLIGAALLLPLPSSSSCVDLHSGFFVQLSLVLDLTMWPRLLWHHMVPSSARDRPAHTHLPSPSQSRLGAISKFSFITHRPVFVCIYVSLMYGSIPALGINGRRSAAMW